MKGKVSVLRRYKNEIPLQSTAMNELSTRREIWDLSLARSIFKVNFGLRGHEPIFSMPMRCYF